MVPFVPSPTRRADSGGLEKHDKALSINTVSEMRRDVGGARKPGKSPIWHLVGSSATHLCGAMRGDARAAPGENAGQKEERGKNMA